MRKQLSIAVFVLALLAAACSEADRGNAAVATVADDAVATPTPEPAPPTPIAEPSDVSVPATAEPTTIPTVAPTTTSTPEPTASSEPAPTTEPTAAPLACERLTGFEGPDAAANWFIVNDGVMGGRSSAAAAFSDDVLRFGGDLVTAGGGFSSIRLALPLGGLGDASELRLRVRTDGRQYEVVAEDVLPGRDRRVSHYGDIAPAAAGEWSEISIELVSMQPRLFGRPVVDAPLDPTATTSIGLFLADGVDGEFAVELDWIDVCRPPELI